MKKTILKSLRKLFSRKDENLVKKDIFLEIGILFFNWAEEYFCKENRNRLLIIEEVLADYDDNPETLKNMTTRWFKNKLTLYCMYKGYVFNPLEHCTTETGKIIMYKINGGKSKEFIFIKSNNE